MLTLATSVVPFLGLWAVMYISLRISYLLVLVLAVPTTGFLVRTYIVFHDCAHGSFFPGRRANSWVGAGLALDHVHTVRGAGVTITSCITQPPVTSIVVASGIIRR